MTGCDSDGNGSDCSGSDDRMKGLAAGGCSDISSKFALVERLWQVELEISFWGI